MSAQLHKAFVGVPLRPYQRVLLENAAEKERITKAEVMRRALEVYASVSARDEVSV